MRGNGNIVDDVRGLSGKAQSLLFDLPGTLSSSDGVSADVLVRVDENLVPYIKVEILRSRLFIIKQSVRDIRPSKLEVVVSQSLLDITESASFVLKGSGSMELEGGTTQLSVRLDGSGHIDLLKLRAETGDVLMNGSGTVQVNVQNNLSVRLNGSGTVLYAGNPGVRADVRGSGRVRRIND